MQNPSLEKTESSQVFTKLLRAAIKSQLASGKTYRDLEKQTGVNNAALCRFVAGRRSLNLASVDLLWPLLGEQLAAELAKLRK